MQYKFYALQCYAMLTPIQKTGKGGPQNGERKKGDQEEKRAGEEKRVGKEKRGSEGKKGGREAGRKGD